MDKPKKGKPKIRHEGDIHQDEVDLVNEHVSKVTGMLLEFLYQGDGREPSAKSHQMYLNEFTKLQRHDDMATPPKVVTCSTCKLTHLEPKRSYSISQKMAMSEAWSRELRLKIKQPEEKRTAPVLVDLEFENWE